MMKEGFCPVLVFLLALISHSGGARAGSAIQESARMETVLLPNSSPLVSFRILFSVGSALDLAGKEGIAALTAALVSGGGTRRHSYSEIIEAMYPMATSFTAQVDKEMTVFYGTTHWDNLERYFSLISEILLEPGWREEDFKRVKSDAT